MSTSADLRRADLARSQAALARLATGAAAAAVGWRPALTLERQWLGAVDGHGALRLGDLPDPGPLPTGAVGPVVDGVGRRWVGVAVDIGVERQVVLAVQRGDRVDPDVLVEVAAGVAAAVEADVRAAWLDVVVRRSTDVVVVRDPGLRITWVSPQVRDALGWEPAEILGTYGELLGHPDEAEAAAELLFAHQEGVGHFEPARFRLAHRDGGWRWFELSVSNLLNDPSVRGIVVLGTDVTAEVEAGEQLRAALDRLAHAAEHDPLTRLPNRAALSARLAAVVARVAELPPGVESGAAVLFCDLDRFKAVNDRHGHTVGDRVLGIIGARLRAVVRADDLVARFGGDEFVVVATGLDGPDDGDELVTRLVAAVEEPIELDGAVHHLSASVGSTPVRPGLGVDELLGVADSAMYRTKTAGRGRAEATEA